VVTEGHGARANEPHADFKGVRAFVSRENMPKHRIGGTAPVKPMLCKTLGRSYRIGYFDSCDVSIGNSASDRIFWERFQRFEYYEAALGPQIRL